MKIFLGGSVREEIPEKYIREAEKLSDYIVNTKKEIICCPDERGIVGKIVKRVMEENEENIIFAVPKIHLKYTDNFKGKIQVITEHICERTMYLIENSDISIFMPGGIGTLHELLTSIECVRAGEYNTKIIIFNFDNYYKDFLKMLDKIYEEKFANKEDTKFYKVVSTMEELIKECENV